jgi:cytidylate kinase
MYFITVSEMVGTNGQKIAQEVAKTLNYVYYGEAGLLKAAGEMGFLSDVQQMDEKAPHLFEKFFSEKPKIHLDRLQSVIFEVAKKGDAIFFGRGSQLLLRSFDCALHVLVTGSKEKRIQRVMEDHQVGREVAERIIERSDNDKRGFLRFAFDEDWLNPQLYDLVINSDKLSVASAAKMIIDGAKSDEIKACGIDSVKSLGVLSLTRRVESSFLEAGIVSPHIFFNVEDVDSIRLYGIVTSEEEKKSVEKVIKGIKDIKKVANDVTVFRGSMGGE